MSLDAFFTFHDDLRQFLKPGNPGGSFAYPVDRRASIKDAVEALGPPHTEVGRITVDGGEVDFSHLLEPGQDVEVYPVEPPMDVTEPSLLRPEPLPHPAFVVDVNVGKLAARLRLIGLDAAYDPTWDDERIAEIADKEGRAALSKDLSLLKRNRISHGRAVRAVHPDDQLLEVLDFFGITGPFEAFSRCIHCNRVLEPVAKEKVIHRLEPLTRKYFEEFHICPGCDRIYWAGSHHEKMLGWLEKVGLAENSKQGAKK
jgi:hypothetical protein